MFFGMHLPNLLGVSHRQMYACRMHIVDELLEERCEKLRANPVLWPVARPVLYKLLNYRAAKHMADDVANLTGAGAFQYITELLGLDMPKAGLEHIPATGRTILIGNHPTGLADGIVVFNALREIRPDLVFLANADALRVIPFATDLIIPVEWETSKRSLETARRTLEGVRQAMKEERALVIFPSGALAKWVPGQGLADKPWETSAVHMARKYKAPIVPMSLTGRNSLIYYLFSMLNEELRDITLFHELLDKTGMRLPIKFGPVIPLDSLPRAARDATAHVRRIVTEDMADTE